MSKRLNFGQNIVRYCYYIMFAALRSTVRRPAHLLRSHSRFGYTRSPLSTQARTSVRGRRLEWSAGAVALVGALAWSNVVHLDAESR